MLRRGVKHDFRKEPIFMRRLPPRGSVFEAVDRRGDAAATGFMFVLVFVLVLALNMTGDALRDALDPRHTSGK